MKQKPFKIKYKPFEECVENVAVTHSPRYMLDMDASKQDTLFTKLEKTYEEIRQMKNPFDAFKDFIVEQRKANLKQRKVDDDFWWYSPNSNQINSIELEDQKFANKMVGLEMQFWNQLTRDEQHFLRAYLLIIFPNIFCFMENLNCVNKRNSKKKRVKFIGLKRKNSECQTIITYNDIIENNNNRKYLSNLEYILSFYQRKKTVNNIIKGKENDKIKKIFKRNTKHSQIKIQKNKEKN